MYVKKKKEKKKKEYINNTVLSQIHETSNVTEEKNDFHVFLNNAHHTGNTLLLLIYVLWKRLL